MVDLSVCITAYNLENVLEQALESVFMQETDYSFEVLIGDDGSQDGTLSIIEKWKDKHPGLIQYFVMPRESGKKYYAIERASLNRINLLEHASGKYILFLDGDDFYTDKKKFQKQIDILEKYPGCSLCAHNMNWYYPKTGMEEPIMDINRQEGIIKRFDYWSGRLHVPAEACILRTDFSRGENIDKDFDDDMIVFLALQKGDCYYIPDIMGNVRRGEERHINWNMPFLSDIVSLMDYDLEVQVNPKWRRASIKRHFYPFLTLLRNRREGLAQKYPELYQRAADGNFKTVSRLMEGRMIGMKDLFFFASACMGRLLKKLKRMVSMK